MKQMTNPVASTTSILGRYLSPDSSIITMERGQDTRCGFSYLYRFGEIILNGLLHISNGQIA